MYVMMSITSPDQTPSRSVHAELSFTPASDVSLDTLRPGGVLRAKTRPEDGYDNNAIVRHTCRIDDLDAGDVKPGLSTMGFDRVDISRLASLQRVLTRVRQAGTLSEADALEIRRRLMGRSVRLSDGKRLRFLYVAPEGIILRRAGPNNVAVDPDEPRTRTSGHDAANSVHGDQDVRGTPVRQILRGAGPWIFRHDAPDGVNRWSPLFLVNIWIPLQQITRPLALMDERTLDRRRHQLRYMLPTEDFLDRAPDRRLNDIWTFLPDDGQRWYFTPEMDFRRAYVFNTLSAPHGAFILPGEAVAGRLYNQLRAAKDAVLRGDRAALAEATREQHDSTAHISTAPLRRAIDDMDALLSEVRATQGDAALTAREAFCARAAAAMDRVVRRSIELRIVSVISPSWLP